MPTKVVFTKKSFPPKVHTSIPISPPVVQVTTSSPIIDHQGGFTRTTTTTTTTTPTTPTTSNQLQQQQHQQQRRRLFNHDNNNNDNYQNDVGTTDPFGTTRSIPLPLQIGTTPIVQHPFANMGISTTTTPTAYSSNGMVQSSPQLLLQQQSQPQAPRSVMSFRSSILRDFKENNATSFSANHPTNNKAFINTSNNNKNMNNNTTMNGITFRGVTPTSTNSPNSTTMNIMDNNNNHNNTTGHGRTAVGTSGTTAFHGMMSPNELLYGRLPDSTTVHHVEITPSSSSHQHHHSSRIRLSKDDIRASPRLTGYMFTMITASVLLISIIKFHNNVNLDDDYDIVNTRLYTTKNGSVVYKWKFDWALYCSGTGLILSFLTVLVHFDTIFVPSLWMSIFKDGSLSERNWIYFLILFWGGSVHICTSTLSVGEIQPNVYFTTWIAFGSVALNYEVWKESAGLTTPPLQPITTTIPVTTTPMYPISNVGSSGVHPNSEPILNNMLPTLEPTPNFLSPSFYHRETSYNWLWTGFFSFLFAGSASDVYYNRTELEFRFVADHLYLQTKDWSIILAVVWIEAFICVVAVVLNEKILPNTPSSSSSSSHDQQQRQRSTQPNGNGSNAASATRNTIHRNPSWRYHCVFGWRQLELILIIIAIGSKFWVILQYTGVDGVINGLSNAYFGVWGSFFNSVFTFGTWIRENKNLEYIIREPVRNN